MTKVIYRVEIFPEGNLYVGLGSEVDVPSFGDNPKDAGDPLQEAIELFLKGCDDMGTLNDALEESGFHKIGDERKLCERIAQNYSDFARETHNAYSLSGAYTLQYADGRDE